MIRVACVANRTIRGCLHLLNGPSRHSRISNIQSKRVLASEGLTCFSDGLHIVTLEVALIVYLFFGCFAAGT